MIISFDKINGGGSEEELLQRIQELENENAILNQTISDLESTIVSLENDMNQIQNELETI